ncbi:MAG: hypothetical protein OEN23_04490 [Paracoccaceae bacterium]|nr:hypothetical protein [Paracoccaceae bacterium]
MPDVIQQASEYRTRLKSQIAELDWFLQTAAEMLSDELATRSPNGVADQVIADDHREI